LFLPRPAPRRKLRSLHSFAGRRFVRHGSLVFSRALDGTLLAAPAVDPFEVLNLLDRNALRPLCPVALVDLRAACEAIRAGLVGGLELEQLRRDAEQHAINVRYGSV
jgi:hypothetical protein